MALHKSNATLKAQKDWKWQKKKKKKIIQITKNTTDIVGGHSNM